MGGTLTAGWIVAKFAAFIVGCFVFSYIFWWTHQMMHIHGTGKKVRK